MRVTSTANKQNGEHMNNKSTNHNSGSAETNFKTEINSI